MDTADPFNRHEIRSLLFSSKTRHYIKARSNLLSATAPRKQLSVATFVKFAAHNRGIVKPTTISSFLSLSPLRRVLSSLLQSRAGFWKTIFFDKFSGIIEKEGLILIDVNTAAVEEKGALAAKLYELPSFDKAPRLYVVVCHASLVPL